MAKRRRRTHKKAEPPPRKRSPLPRGSLLLVVAGILIAWGAWAYYSRGGAEQFTDPVRRALQPFLEKPGAPRHRVLVVGWDGASFNMIDPLVAAGRLPNVQRLLTEGISAELESTIIPISAAAWTSAVTGKGPAKTGLFSFFTPVENSYRIQLVSARDRRAPAVWQFLNHYGLKTHVVGVPVTYPPEPLDGVMIAGMLSPFNAEYAHPPGLADALRGLGFIPDLDIWRTVQPQDPRQIVARQHALKVRITSALLEDSDWDFALIVFKSLDVLQHRLLTGATTGPVADHYERLDAALGRLRRAAGANTDVLLVSDHGFGLYTHHLSVMGCLVKLGLATLKSTPDRPTADLDKPLAESIAAVHADQIGRLDMSKTLVYCESDSAEGNFAALRLNLRGREPAGIVAPEQREAVLDEVIDKLRSLKATPDGPPLFTRVMRLTDVYQGPYTANLPDILLEAQRKYRCKPWLERRFIRALKRPAAQHELSGVLVAAGPSFQRSAARGHASILDVAPTVLQLFGLPVSDQMDGRVLTEFLRGDVRVAVVNEQELKLADDSGRIYGGDEAAQVYRRLQALGYVGDERSEGDEPREPEP